MTELEPAPAGLASDGLPAARLVHRLAHCLEAGFAVLLDERSMTAFPRDEYHRRQCQVFAFQDGIVLVLGSPLLFEEIAIGTAGRRPDVDRNGIRASSTAWAPSTEPIPCSLTVIRRPSGVF